MPKPRSAPARKPAASPGSAPLAFRAVMLIEDGNPYVPVSPSQAGALKPGWRKPLPVLVRINGKPTPPWRINMMPKGGGRFHLYLHGDVRKASGTGVGDEVDVEVRFDAAYRNGPMHPMPAWFAKALAGDRRASANWEALPPSRQKEVLRYFSRLQSEEAKVRNLEKALRVLGGEAGRFLARTWRDGR